MSLGQLFQHLVVKHLDTYCVYGVLFNSNTRNVSFKRVLRVPVSLEFVVRNRGTSTKGRSWSVSYKKEISSFRANFSTSFLSSSY